MAEDVFGQNDSVPSISFNNLPVGTSYTGVVTEAPRVVQARDYETEKPAFYEDGNPKMTIVTKLLVDGEERSLWAPIPSAMKTAVLDAQKAAGVPVDVGGTLTVTFIGEKANPDRPKLNAQKLYAATYVPPKGNAFASQEEAPKEEAPKAQAVASIGGPERPAGIDESLWATLDLGARNALVARPW